MIIATIGNQDYALADIKDAEALLQILNRATTITDHYRGDYTGRYFTPNSDRRSITVEISTCEIVPAEEHTRIQAEKAQAKADSKVTDIKAA